MRLLALGDGIIPGGYVSPTASYLGSIHRGVASEERPLIDILPAVVGLIEFSKPDCQLD